MKLILSFILFTLTTFLTSCDPYYSISLTNKTADTVSVIIKQNYKFSSNKIEFGKTKDDYKIYKVTPNEIFKVGSAIAEIDNDIPFDNILIVSRNDTTKANNIEEIKMLFDKKTFGRLKTPYNITIK